MSAYSFSRPLYKNQQHLPASPQAHTPYAPFHEDSDADYIYNRSTPAPSYRSLPQSHPSPPPPPPKGFHSQHDFEHEPLDRAETIPLDIRHGKHGSSTATIAPMLPAEEEDPFVRDIDPRKARRRRGRTQQDVRDNDDGWFSGRITWAVYLLTVIQLAVFVAEIVKNAVLTKSPIEIHPSFNPMIGPSPYVMINMGSRFDPCMHSISGIQNNVGGAGLIQWPCPNATSTTPGAPGATCSLHELCGFGAKHDTPAPNQWFRFISPIFIHAGIVHIGFNLLLQLTLGRDVERLIGSTRFIIVYLAAGIFGFILGGNFAADAISSCGCSGSLFGILAITLLDLLYFWRSRPSPIRDLAFIGLDIIIAFILGLLPGLDNFSHIGGFIMGLLLGVCVLRSPPAIARAGNGDKSRNPPFSARDPLASLVDRRPAWWAWWLVRALALIGALIGFVLLLENFYTWRVECSWCKYLSCLPITVSGTNWCAQGTLNFQRENSTSMRRDLLF